MTVTLGRFAIAFALIAVASLNAILLLGAAGHYMGAPTGLFDGIVLILDVSLIVSSILLGLIFARLKWRVLSALFWGNVALFIVAAVVRLLGISVRPALLFAADLYWLDLYLVVLARHWHSIAHC